MQDLDLTLRDWQVPKQTLAFICALVLVVLCVVWSFGLVWHSGSGLPSFRVWWLSSCWSSLAMVTVVVARSWGQREREILGCAAPFLPHWVLRPF